MEKSPDILNKIEQTHKHICDECQSGIFYPPKEYRMAAEHILNAATLLYNDAAGIVRRDTTRGQKSTLTLEQIYEVLQKILKTMFTIENLPVKEDLVQKILDEYHLDAGVFLVSDDWSGNFYPHVGI